MANDREVERLVSAAKARQYERLRREQNEERNDAPEAVKRIKQKVTAALAFDGDGAFMDGAKALGLEFHWFSLPYAGFMFRERWVQLWYGTLDQMPADEDAHWNPEEDASADDERNAWRMSMVEAEDSFNLHTTREPIELPEIETVDLHDLTLDTLLLVLDECDTRLTQRRKEMRSRRPS